MEATNNDGWETRPRGGGCKTPSGGERLVVRPSAGAQRRRPDTPPLPSALLAVQPLAGRLPEPLGMLARHGADDARHVPCGEGWVASGSNERVVRGFVRDGGLRLLAHARAVAAGGGDHH